MEWPRHTKWIFVLGIILLVGGLFMGLVYPILEVQGRVVVLPSHLWCISMVGPIIGHIGCIAWLATFPVKKDDGQTEGE